MFRSPTASRLRRAIAGRIYPNVDRLRWLEALLYTYQHREHIFTPDAGKQAEEDMLREVEGLLADLRKLAPKPRKPAGKTFLQYADDFLACRPGTKAGHEAVAFTICIFFVAVGYFGYCILKAVLAGRFAG